MARSDYGKPRNRTEHEPDNGQRGDLGPFLFHLSGYAPSRNQKSWYRDVLERSRHAWVDWSSKDLKKELEPFPSTETDESGGEA